MLMNAKQFCSETGWPLKTIRRMCRTGQLEHWQRGRVYLLNKDETLVRLELFKNQNIPAQVSDLPRQRKCRITALPDAGFDGYSSRAERMNNGKRLGQITARLSRL